MKINKFETIGVGVSILAMAVALFLVRVNTVADEAVAVTDDSQVASVLVSGDSDIALADALGDALSPTGSLDKMIVDDIVLGNGREVKNGDTIEVHYVGALRSGQEFDNSFERGTPFTFTVGEGRVIAGWDSGVIGMKEGGQRILVIPSDYAYGNDGFGPIPGGATLVFNIELLSINQ